MTILKNSNCDTTWILKVWQNSTTQIVTKLENPNCDRKEKKNQIVSEKKSTKKFYKTQEVKLWQNSITQKVSTQKVKMWQN